MLLFCVAVTTLATRQTLVSCKHRRVLLPIREQLIGEERCGRGNSRGKERDVAGETPW